MEQEQSLAERVSAEQKALAEDITDMSDVERPDAAIDAWLQAWVSESSCENEHDDHDDEVDCAAGAREILAYIADLEAKLEAAQEALREIRDNAVDVRAELAALREVRDD